MPKKINRLKENIRESFKRDELECIYMVDRLEKLDEHGRVLARVYINLPPMGKQKGITMHSILLPLEVWDHLSLFLLKVNSRVVSKVYGEDDSKEKSAPENHPDQQ